MINMANPIDDSNYLWQEETSEGHTRIGLNNEARNQIGQISYASFPKNLNEVRVGEEFFSFEGAKAVEDIHSPQSGKVARVNTELLDHPDYLNDADKEKNWIIELY
ncbi:glycine cleavage system protein H [Lentilactobacillus hilgardii]|uniref:glycine cleavage system protein H n=1 Tax=Lentilactobacillus hilgardii TaxID=1588 RepID=UPI0021C3BE34|nr:glycine cleavage system protein H [Lentilactobacillus hilgardii]MCP9333325.1 glycine cleavage system protein H [Lentilactobacillus hilgardii]MCP9349934.1 glycine cleavage system protein H [Lentilactobacillus hilgardii]MCP9352862.1 glycine cleavage system protein H [Lentilactobacillus hilgardii]